MFVKPKQTYYFCIVKIQQRKFTNIFNTYNYDNKKIYRKRES